MNWLKALFSSTDAGSDSVIVGGLFAILSLTAFTAGSMWQGHPFDPTSYALAAGGLIAAIAGGKRLRDGGQNG